MYYYKAYYQWGSWTLFNTDELGEQAEEIMTASLKDFTDKYGKSAGQIVKSYENTDFGKLP